VQLANSCGPRSRNHAMLGQMADPGHMQNPAAPAAAPVDEEKVALASTHGGALVASGDTVSGETVVESINRPPSVALLADLERRVRRLEARIDELEVPARSSRRLVKVSDVVRWGLWLVVIALLAFYWLRLGAPR
jgi:hypothetical protein